MKAKVIMTDEEWEMYKQSLSVARAAHSPAVPPSFPVLVITELRSTEMQGYWAYRAEHSFIEAADLKRMLLV
jgi:hypothetical protein